MKKSILRLLSFTYLLFSGLLFAENEVPTPPTARPGGSGVILEHLEPKHLQLICMFIFWR
jgi:hypothetical protein